MKWAKLVVVILGTIVGALLIGYGAWFSASSIFGIVLIVVGVVVFCCALLFYLKWVKWVVIILGALVGAFLIACGIWFWLWSAYYGDFPGLGIVLIIAGIGVFLCALIFRRQTARSIQWVGKYLWATGKYLWATKYRRWGLILSMVIIAAVGTLLVVQAQHRETLNVLQYNGHDWSRMSTDTRQTLADVWGTSSSDVFTVGTGPILHYDGNTWSAMTSGPSKNLSGVWGSSSSDVFAVGSGGTIVHYDGNAWSAMTSGTSDYLTGIWGSSSSDVFAVGWDYTRENFGIILHYDGNTWSAMISGDTGWFRDIWGSSSSDVFAVGVGGTIMHYDGHDWSRMSTDTRQNLADVWGNSSSDVFAVGRAPH